MILLTNENYSAQPNLKKIGMKDLFHVHHKKKCGLVNYKEENLLDLLLFVFGHERTKMKIIVTLL